MSHGNSWRDDPHKRQKWMNFMRSAYPDIDPGTVGLMDEIRMVSHKLHQIGEKSLVNPGISSAQFRLLLSLKFAQIVSDQMELNPSQISERQGTSRNTISGLIRSLEENGFVERRLDKEDRRRFNIGLTDKGSDLVHEHMQIYFEAVDYCLGALSTAEQSSLSTILYKIRQAAEELANHKTESVYQ